VSDNNLGAVTERRSSRQVKRVAAKAPVLPSARAAVGALLCVLAALLTFVAYRQAQQPPTTKYLVAVREMEPGASLTVADFREEPITLPLEVAARSFTSFAQIEGAFLLGPIQQGELLQASNLVRRAGGPGSHEWSFSIESVNAAGGRIRVGERIQILGTTSSEGQSVTEVVNPSALVIGLDRTDPNPFRGSLTILLALTSDEEVFRLETAKNTQKLTVVRVPGASQPSNAAPTAKATAKPKVQAAPNQESVPSTALSPQAEPTNAADTPTNIPTNDPTENAS
jgi:Flp pilus assembly protein CpaB